jgi:hypothetical protein
VVELLPLLIDLAVEAEDIAALAETVAALEELAQCRDKKRKRPMMARSVRLMVLVIVIVVFVLPRLVGVRILRLVFGTRCTRCTCIVPHAIRLGSRSPPLILKATGGERLGRRLRLVIMVKMSEVVLKKR